MGKEIFQRRTKAKKRKKDFQIWTDKFSCLEGEPRFSAHGDMIFFSL